MSEKICYQNCFEILFEFNQTETKSWRLINLQHSFYTRLIARALKDLQYA